MNEEERRKKKVENLRLEKERKNNNIKIITGENSGLDLQIKVYKEIQTLSGIDENLFKGLEEAEEIGILNTSLILGETQYEIGHPGMTLNSA